MKLVGTLDKTKRLGLVCVVAITGGVVLFSSLERFTWSRSSGQIVLDDASITRSVEVVNSITAGSSSGTVEFTILIQNRSERPFRILGMKSDCSCHEAGLPLVIAPFSTENLKITTAIDSLQPSQQMAKEVLLVHDQGGPGVKVRLVASFE